MRSSVRRALILGAAAVVILGALSGWLGYRSYQAAEDRRFEQMLVQAGRQAAVNLTTIDYQRADADVRRILDSATGEFYNDFKARSAPLIDVVKKVQSTSVGTVSAAGLESVDGTEGRVLVAVTVMSATAGSPAEQPRYWRMRLTLTADPAGSGDAKVSRVDVVS